ncbi:MAG TPA: FUSC family protein [Pseudonocardia sp.]
MLAHWFGSLVDRFLASDHGLLRFRFALRAVLSVSLAAGVQYAVGQPSTALLLGCVAAMVSSTSIRGGTVRARALTLVLFGVAMTVSLTLAALLSGQPIVGDAVFVVVMFVAVYLRRFDQLGMASGMGAFMAYFFATYLHAQPAALPRMYLGVLIGLLCSGLMALVVFRDTPRSTFRRTYASLRAQLARLVDELAELLDDGAPLAGADQLPRAVARQATRLHETTLQIEDNADDLGLDPQWQRQLVDAELSADRLARATVRALGDGLDPATRADLAGDLRGLHRFVDRDPTAALSLDPDELLRRIARYDIRGGPGVLASSPEHHTLLVHRAIRELLLAVVQIRRTTDRMLERPGDRGAAVTSDRELTLEDTDQELEAGPARSDPPAAPVRELNPSTRSAIQASIGGALAIAGGELLSAQRWYWAVIASFIVFAGTTTRGDLLVKSWRRLWGTLLGIVAGTVLATLLHGDLVLTAALLLICIFLAFYTLWVSYSTMTFFITIMLGMLYDILGTFSPDVLLLRLEETAIGVAASTIAAMLVLPKRTRSTVLVELRDFFTALHTQLRDAERLLVHAERVSVIASTREVDRTATDLRTAIAPMLHRLSPARVRRGHATRLITLTEESALAARNLARAAEPGALAGVPEAADTLERLIANTDVLLAATDTRSSPAELESGPALGPRVDVPAAAEAHAAGSPDRIAVLHLRRVVNCLDRLDKTLLGMAAPLARTVTITRGHPRHAEDHPAAQP